MAVVELHEQQVTEECCCGFVIAGPLTYPTV